MMIDVNGTEINVGDKVAFTHKVAAMEMGLL